MHHSLRFYRPQQQKQETKRPRRRFREPIQENTTYEYTYKCYQCGSPYTTVLSAGTEIECVHCNSRVIKKESSKKPHVLDAV